MEIGGSWTNEPPSLQTKKHALTVVETALEQGINFFDHADIYCRGKSEEVFSQIWQEKPGLRDQIVLQSKCGIRFADDPVAGLPQRYDFSYEYIVKSAEGILQRLQTDYLDLLLLHRPDALVEPAEVAKAFDELHQSGKVRYFGVSNHTPAQVELLKKYLNQPLVVNQLQLSLLHTHLIDEGIVANQDNPTGPVRGHGTLEYCRLHGISIQAWSPLARGVASGAADAEGKPASEVSALVKSLAEEKHVSREAIVIAWLLRHPAGIQPVIGTTNPARIKAVCQADSIKLTREEWYALFTAGRGSKLP
jgi:predicted oxidoreductase